MSPVYKKENPAISISQSKATKNSLIHIHKVEKLSMSNYILYYWDSGLSFFPIKWGETTPLEKDFLKYEGKTPKARELAEWLDTYQHFNIGLFLGKLSRTVAFCFPSLESMRDWFWRLSEKNRKLVASSGFISAMKVNSQLAGIFLVMKTHDQKYIPRKTKRGGNIRGTDLFLYWPSRRPCVLGSKYFILLPPSRVGDIEFELWMLRSFNAEEDWEIVSPISGDTLKELINSL